MCARKAAISMYTIHTVVHCRLLTLVASVLLLELPVCACVLVCSVFAFVAFALVDSDETISSAEPVAV